MELWAYSLHATLHHTFTGHCVANQVYFWFPLKLPFKSFKLYCMILYCTVKMLLIWSLLSLYEQLAARGRHNDEMIRLEVWHLPYSFRNVLGRLLASAQNTEYITRHLLLLRFLLMKVDFEISWAPHLGFGPWTFSATGQDSTTFLTIPLKN